MGRACRARAATFISRYRCHSARQRRTEPDPRLTVLLRRAGAGRWTIAHDQRRITHGDARRLGHAAGDRRQRRGGVGHARRGNGRLAAARVIWCSSMRSMPAMDGLALGQAGTRPAGGRAACALILLTTASQPLDNSRMPQQVLHAACSSPSRVRICSTPSPIQALGARARRSRAACANGRTPAGSRVAPVLLAEDGLVNQRVAVGLLATAWPYGRGCEQRPQAVRKLSSAPRRSISC